MADLSDFVARTSNYSMLKVRDNNTDVSDNRTLVSVSGCRLVVCDVVG